MGCEQKVTIANEMGIHVRPATAVAEAARRYRARVVIEKAGQEVDAKSCIELLTLAAVKGSELLIRAEGEDAEEAVADLIRLIESGFGEIK
jgi:phosphocarrier protein